MQLIPEVAKVAKHLTVFQRTPNFSRPAFNGPVPAEKKALFDADPEAYREHIHCSTPEREALRGLLAVGLVDCFRRFEQPEKSFSWWDYRQGAFRRNMGLRIDLILASEALAHKCTACTIDPGPRKLERPSDHTPVVATFADD